VKRLLELVGETGGLGWVAVKAVLMFAVAVIGLRLGERHTLAQLGAFDFAVAVAIGAIIGRTVTAPSASFAVGAVALVTLLVVHRLVAFARRHSRIARIIDHPPRVLVAGGKIQDRELARAGLTTADVHALRGGPGSGRAAHRQVDDARRLTRVAQCFEHRAADAARRVVILDDDARFPVAVAASRRVWVSLGLIEYRSRTRPGCRRRQASLPRLGRRIVPGTSRPGAAR
jgi:hypothetical protein